MRHVLARALLLLALVVFTLGEQPQRDDDDSAPAAVVEESGSDGAQEGEAYLPPVLMGSYQVTTAAALKAEMVAAEYALEARAVVDGPVQVYDSPMVSISVRKVSNEMLLKNSTSIEALDGAGVTVPRGVQSKSGKPVTITITSYHASEKIMKNLPEDIRVRFEKERANLTVQATAAGEPDGGSDADSSSDAAANLAENVDGTAKGTLNGTEANSTKIEESKEPDGTAKGTEANSTIIEEPKEPDERVDFFTTKTSVSWRGSVNVKYAGLSATVPAHDRTPGQGPGGATFGNEEVLYADEKKEIYKEVEAIIGLPELERSRAFRRLARRWHPDKNPDDVERATDVFNYLQELKEDLLGEGGKAGMRIFA